MQRTKVLTVLSHEWEKLMTPSARVAYLQRRLDLVAGIPSAEPPPASPPPLEHETPPLGWFLF